MPIDDQIRDEKLQHDINEAKNDQIKFTLNLGKIKKGNNKKRSKEQKTHYTILTYFTKQENEVIKFFDEYSSVVSEVKNKAKK